MRRNSDSSRDAQRADWKAVRKFGVIRSVICFFGPAGWWTDWYYPEGVHGKVWNFFHGYGWKVM